MINVHNGSPHEKHVKGGNFLSPHWIITFSHLLICTLLPVDFGNFRCKKREGSQQKSKLGCIQQKNELFETFLLEVVNMYVRLECL